MGESNPQTSGVWEKRDTRKRYSFFPLIIKVDRLGKSTSKPHTFGQKGAYEEEKIYFIYFPQK